MLQFTFPFSPLVPTPSSSHLAITSPHHPITLSPCHLIPTSTSSPPQPHPCLNLITASTLPWPRPHFFLVLRPCIPLSIPFLGHYTCSPWVPVLSQLLSWSSCTIHILPFISVLILDPEFPLSHLSPHAPLSWTMCSLSSSLTTDTHLRVLWYSLIFVSLPILTQLGPCLVSP